MRAFVLLTILSAMGCSSSGETSADRVGVDGGGDTRTDGVAETIIDPNPCEGLGCASMPGKLVVKVVDAKGAPVTAPTFTESGTTLAASCEGGSDAGTCASGWTFAFLSQGSHSIVVAATGYSPKTINVNIQGPVGCCGQGPEVDETVTLGSAAP